MNPFFMTKHEAILCGRHLFNLLSESGDRAFPKLLIHKLTYQIKENSHASLI
jgi:hypothetical protein